MCPRFSFAAYSPSAKQFKMCYCVVICFLNNQCFIGSRRNASPLPYKIRADPHWALTQGLSFLGRLALFVEVLVASKQVTFKKEEINLAPGWAVMSSACLTWPCRDGGPRAGFKDGQWLDVSFPVNFPEGPEQSTASCMGPSAASFFPLLLPLLPVDLHAGAALHSLLERVLGSPIAKAHLVLAGP